LQRLDQLPAMTSKRRRAARSSTSVVETWVYDGRFLLGRVAGRLGALRAASASGRKLGTFATTQAATLAIVVAAREANG
jgi:hypothetical protein